MKSRGHTGTHTDDTGDAQGMERFEARHGVEELLRAREEAQGVDLFSDPDAAAPAEAVVSGSTGEERLGDTALELAEPEEEYDRQG